MEGRWLIRSVKLEGARFHEPSCRGYEIAGFFKKLYKKDTFSRSTLDGLPFNTILANLGVLMEREFEEEVKHALLDCGGKRMDSTLLLSKRHGMFWKVIFAICFLSFIEGGDFVWSSMSLSLFWYQKLWTRWSFAITCPLVWWVVLITAGESFSK